MTSMISSPKEPEYIMDPHAAAHAKVRYIWIPATIQVQHIQR